MTADDGNWISGPMINPPARLSEVLAELTDRQRALYWLTRAEASSIDERLMLVPMLARQIRATMPDVIAVREALLSGHTREAGSRGDGRDRARASAVIMSPHPTWCVTDHTASADREAADGFRTCRSVADADYPAAVHLTQVFGHDGDDDPSPLVAIPAELLGPDSMLTPDQARKLAADVRATLELVSLTTSQAS